MSRYKKPLWLNGWLWAIFWSALAVGSLWYLFQHYELRPKTPQELERMR